MTPGSGHIHTLHLSHTFKNDQMKYSNCSNEYFTKKGFLNSVFKVFFHSSTLLIIVIPQQCKVEKGLPQRYSDSKLSLR